MLPSPSPGSSITVVYHYPAPPASVLNQFTALTGVKVNWVEVGWDNLQTKIAAAAASNTYFADLTDVDWSKVGQYYKTKWFMPLNSYFDVATLKTDMPQINTFASNNQQLALPFDSSFTVTTLNTKIAKAAGVTTTPATITDYNTALGQIKAKGTVPTRSTSRSPRPRACRPTGTRPPRPTAARSSTPTTTRCSPRRARPATRR